MTDAAYPPITGKKLCAIEGCGRPHRAKGMCHRHYYRKARGSSLNVRETCACCGGALPRGATVRRKYCSPTCEHSAWVTAHREQENAYQRDRWRTNKDQINGERRAYRVAHYQELRAAERARARKRLRAEQENAA